VFENRFSELYHKALIQQHT
jgi:hypothetical protein